MSRAAAQKHGLAWTGGHDRPGKGCFVCYLIKRWSSILVSGWQGSRVAWWLTFLAFLRTKSQAEKLQLGRSTKPTDAVTGLR